MDSLVYYRKWRPQNLAEVVGQKPITQTLLNALESGRVSHAYLFCGPRGTGKTSTGRILAKAVNCETNNGRGEPCNACPMCQAITEGTALDVIEIDAASNRGIDEIRDLREKVNYAPNLARYKVYIIDEFHMLTKEASNALLKTLEEPPPHVIFILATTEAHKVLPTIMSRCQRFDFRRISQQDLTDKLAQIGKAEGINIKPEGLRLIARSATGSLRDAENLLQQLTTYYGSNVELHQIQTILGVTGDFRVKELARHIANNDVSAGMRTINSINSDGLDLKQFNRELVEYLRGLLLVKTGTDGVLDFTDEDIAELKAMAAGVSLTQVLKAVKLFGQLELGLHSHSTLPLELALVDCIPSVPEEKATPGIREGHESHQPKKAEPSPKPRVSSEPVAAEPVSEEVAGVVPEPEAKVQSESPEVESESQATEEVAADSQANGELERLLQNWKRIIEEAPPDIKKTTAAAILRSADVRPVAIEGDTVILASKYDFYKDKIDKPENQEVAEKMIGLFLGRVCRVRCVHRPEENHLLREALKMGAKVTSVEEK